MIAQIISIGTELLMGQVLNTNAQFVSRRLAALGVTQHHQVTVGDNPQRLREAYATALSRVDVVITSGGLGPTGDDITKGVLAELLGVALVVHADALLHVETYFKKRLNRPMAHNNLAQTLFTADSTILPNENGTAPGAIVPCPSFGQNKVVIHLPGPPGEFEPMFDQSVAPYLKARSGQCLVSRYIRIFGMGESEVDLRLSDLMKGVNHSLSPYCSLGEVQLRATALCASVEQGDQMLAPVIQKVRDTLGDVVYAINQTDEGSLQETVVTLFKGRKQTVSVCESVTGGMLSSLLVSVPGASEVFAGGLITYTNAQKTALAGVEPATLQTYGAVSAPCAIEMAQGTRARTQTDWAVALTGCAGPGSDDAHTPVGLVYIALASKQGATAYSFKLSGSRQRIRTLACLNALNLLRTQDDAK